LKRRRFTRIYQLPWLAGDTARPVFVEAPYLADGEFPTKGQWTAADELVRYG